MVQFWFPLIGHVGYPETVPPPATPTCTLFVIGLALVVPLLAFPLHWALSRGADRATSPGPDNSAASRRAAGQRVPSGPWR